MFSFFIRYFNQGPFNDMIYSIMGDSFNQWDISLLPCQRSIKRKFHFVTNQDTKTHQLVISISGLFKQAATNNGDVIEGKKGLPLGEFSGKTVVNLNTKAAKINTSLKMIDQDKWMYS